MNNEPRLALRKIIAKYGNGLAGDRRRVEGLLKDLCGEYRREINVLTNAVEERVPLDLLAANRSTPRAVLLTKLVKRLEDNLGLTPEAANWAVDSWALALGVLSDQEIAAKEKKQSETLQPPAPTKPIQSAAPQTNKTSVEPRNTPSTAPRPAQNLPNKPPPKIYPPISARPPANLPTPLPKAQPPQRRQPGNTNVGLPQTPAQTNNQIQNTAQNAEPKSIFRKFFGCLFILFLLAATGVVLLFGVPYAIEVMRETQRTEPRRFPGQ